MKKLIFVSIFAALLVSCSKKEEAPPALEGTWSGILTSQLSGNDVDGPYVSQLTVTLNDGKFTYADDIPCNQGCGTYSVEGYKISFSDTADAVRQALYLWWSLDGDYEFSLKENQLILTREYDGSSEIFILAK